MSILNDKEVAVIIDSLSLTRDRIRSGNPESPTPNIDSALAKIYTFVSPASSEIRLLPVTSQVRANEDLSPVRPAQVSPAPLNGLDKIAFEFAAEMEVDQSDSGRHVDFDSLMRRWAGAGYRVTVEALDVDPDCEDIYSSPFAGWEDPETSRVYTNGDLS